MKAGKKFEMYFPAILFCETSRRNERKDLCYDGARKILSAIERVCSIQRLAYPGCKERGCMSACLISCEVGGLLKW